ncbi:hypothetical protein BofuT4_P014000.1 [Botrytis cinerea T4]|uniref:Uncharacterized protein n=1 Tax=Botryotinia fuckeliana (strain T4) TaxID=999810 RepID=G2XN16_BOTF4|nr:hypothetical protein BofuT4_P014000.1 [Botrytis cinerea T4]
MVSRDVMEIEVNPYRHQPREMLRNDKDAENFMRQVQGVLECREANKCFRMGWWLDGSDAVGILAQFMSVTPHTNSSKHAEVFTKGANEISSDKDGKISPHRHNNLLAIHRVGLDLLHGLIV